MAQKLKRKRTEIAGPRKVCYSLTSLTAIEYVVVKAARTKKFDENIIDHGEQSEFDDSRLRASEITDEDEDSDQAADKDSEEWTGDGGTQAPIPFKPVNCQLSEDNERRPPVGGELRTIREASDLFKSSSFKLQVRKSLFRFWTVSSCDSKDRCASSQRPTKVIENCPVGTISF